MDYFNGIANDDFIAYFLVDLNSRKELTQYIYPHDGIEPVDIIDEHTNRCKDLLSDYIINNINEAIYENAVIVKGDEVQYVYDKKKKEIFPLLEGLIMKYLEDVKINIIDLSEDK
jgi:hypothetical protein